MKGLKKQLFNGLFALMIAFFAVGCSSKSDEMASDGFAMGASETAMEDTQVGEPMSDDLGAVSTGRGR